MRALDLSFNCLGHDRWPAGNVDAHSTAFGSAAAAAVAAGRVVSAHWTMLARASVSSTDPSAACRRFLDLCVTHGPRVLIRQRCAVWYGVTGERKLNPKPYTLNR